MRILLSNDDGVFAPGLAALRAAAEEMGEVTVAAPQSGQSAVGHAITLDDPLEVQDVALPGGGSALSIAGRPADCVRLAIRRLLPSLPDLVLSGINAGANVGVNVFYSGTVAAAAEAAMLGIPAVAISAACATGEYDFAAAGRACRWVLRCLIDGGLSAGELLNVNVPAGPGAQPCGVRVVPQSTAEISDVYHLCRSEGDSRAYHLGAKYSFAHQADTDVHALAEGFITVTPLHVDMTNHDRLVSLGRLDWPAPPFE